MNQTFPLEPTAADLRASYQSKANTRLARAIWPYMGIGAYDRLFAHRWALKLISSDPHDGREVVACLVNFTYMIEGALKRYDADRHYQARHDKVAAAYQAWLKA